MTGEELKTATEQCISRLKELGHTEWSQRLEDVVAGAATGGELVMGVRWNLRELERSGLELPADVRALSRDIIEAINQTGW